MIDNLSKIVKHVPFYKLLMLLIVLYYLRSLWALLLSYELF